MTAAALPRRIGLLLLLGLFVALRVGTILDDRTWYDEDYVLLEAYGVRYLEPWPTTFVRSQLDWPKSVGAALDNLAHFDAYPPLMALLLRLVRDAWNPIVAARLLLLAVNALLMVNVYVWMSRRFTPTTGLTAAAYIGWLPLLVETSQQIKWSALAPALATLAAFLLLAQLERPSWRGWGAYVLVMTLLLHTHYFCVWVVPAHAAFVLLFARRLWLGWAVAVGLVALLCSPWYLLGLPEQSHYVGWFFKTWLAAQSPNPWYQPLTARSSLLWLGWNLAATFGFEPSHFRARLFLPLLAPLGWLLVRAWRAAHDGVRQLARLSVVTYGVAYAAQSLYAAHLGHTTPLTGSYFVPWVPLVLAATVAGALAVPSPTWCRLLLFGVVGVSLANSLADPYPVQITQTRSMNRYRGVANALEREGPSVAIVFRSDRDAKMVNLFYAGERLQCLATTPDWTPPSSATGLLFVGSRWAEPVRSPGAGWSCRADQTIGETRLDRCERVPQ